MKNVVLVGFMGTGKTALSRALSDKLKMKYISTDDLIEKKEGASITEIFSKKGEGYFRKIEKEVVKEVSSMRNVVVDAGGGVVIDPENVKNLKENASIICLWADPEVILNRTKKRAHRPLLNVDKPLEKIKELLEVRKPFYEMADHHINTSKMSAEDVVHEAEKILNDIYRN